ncbi:MAG: threonine synthase [Eubacteriaceae bacterium]|jgi:threonine synthase|nr:threonine synthase [Eubacteriaceae bacterium]
MKEQYISTRGTQEGLSASSAIIKGIASDGGLFVASHLNRMNLPLKDWLSCKTYSDFAQKVLSLFLTDFTASQIEHCVTQAYETGKFSSQEPVQLEDVGDRAFLELYHGPTAAFKDMALTILPHLMTTALKNVGADHRVLILTATSGDTGKAALEGFKDVPGIGIVVYYPKDGVSLVQEKQMITQEGDNTKVVGVVGNFDDTQTGVKLIFNNETIKAQLMTQNTVLSSANSINIGRLLPQIVYYFYSYFELVRRDKIVLGDAVNYVVPTGNFGNILAGYYARKMGLPVHKFVCASNNNCILTDFINTGVYDTKRPFYKTSSPSMDILVSSNLERLLYDLCGEDASVVKGYMDLLNTEGVYRIDEELLGKVQELFYGGFADENATKDAIRKTFEEKNYLMDPHTAVANAVYEAYVQKTADNTPAVILSTASPFKFSQSVYESLYGESPEDMDPFQQLKELSQQTGVPIPKPLQDLETKPVRHQTVVDKQDMATVLESI